MLNRLLFSSIAVAATLFGSNAFATCTITNTIVNGSPADAVPLMQNFNDLATCVNSTAATLAPLAGPSFTGNVGIGTTSPDSALTINATGSSGAAVVGTGAGIHMIGNSSANRLLQIETYGVTPLITSRRAQGTGAAPTAVTTGLGFFNIGGSGWDGTAFFNAAAINFIAGENWASGHHGSYAQLRTIANATTTLRDVFLVDGNGGVGIGASYVAPGTPPANGLAVQGNVGIGRTTPGQALDVVGTIRQSGCTTAGTLSANTSGDIICTSDARLKNILGAYRGGLDALARITPQLFTYKTTANDPVETFVHAGFIAQNVREAIPQASALQANGFYSLDTTAIVAATVNGIQELKAINDSQAKEIGDLKDRLRSQDTRLRQQTSDLSGMNARIGALETKLLNLVADRDRTKARIVRTAGK